MPAIVHVTAEHAADDARVTARELVTLLEEHSEAWIVARPPRGPLPEGLRFIEGPAYRRASRFRADWPALDAAVRRTPGPRIVHAHEPETVLAAGRFGWCDPGHLIYDVHEYHGAMMAHRARGLRRWLLRRLGDARHAEACRTAGHVIAVNEELAEDARRHGATSVHVLSNAPRLLPSATDDAPVERSPDRLIYVGGLSAPRGLGTLLEAFATIRREHPAAELELIGPAVDAEARDRLAHPPEGVQVRGPRPPAEAIGRMRQASVGLIPFERVVHYRGRPVKLLEYAAAGLSIVSTSGGPKQQWILGHEAGVVVPPGDAAALAAACLERLRDPDLARREGRRAAAAAADLAWERNEGPQLLEIYRRVLGDAAASDSASDRATVSATREIP
ncbi:MAG: glycosyltransferase family 4 protein [Planctomycetota bacterium]|jgi:glycosyltransferase involved in cell wall biosynthesis